MAEAACPWVYSRPGESLELHPSLLVLEDLIPGLHVGGKSALEWYGVRQYVSQQSVLHLYGWVAARLPEWFTRHFPSEYHRKRLFKEKPQQMAAVVRFEMQHACTSRLHARAGLD